jgi:hypothetical protein
MQDTISAGDPAAWGVRAWRYTTADPIRKIPIDLTTCTLVITDPAGVQTTSLIGAMRHPGVGRYELDRTHVLAGDYIGDWTLGVAFVDEDGNNRTLVIIKREELYVAPT